MNYIKDSNNNYVLYVKQGEDYTISIPLSSLPITLINGVILTGEIKQHSSSLKSTSITLTKTSSNIVLNISADDTISLVHGKYSFDVFAEQNNTKSVVIYGTVVPIQTVTRG